MWLKRILQVTIVVTAAALCFLVWRALSRSPVSPPPEEADSVAMVVEESRSPLPPGATWAPLTPELEGAAAPAATGRISGSIYRSGGAGESVLVTASYVPTGAPGSGEAPSHKTPGDAEDRFAFSDLPLGRYTLVATAGGVSGTARCLLSRDTPHAEVALTLGEAVPLGGTVVGPEGEPVTSGVLHPWLLDGRSTTRGTWLGLSTGIGGDGGFLFPHLDPGAWSIFVVAPGFAPTVSPPLEAGKVDHVIRLAAGVAVSGRVVADPPFETDGGVTVFSGTSGLAGPMASAACDATVAFAFPALAPGAYRIHVSEPTGRYALTGDPVWLTVGTEPIDNLELLLSWGGEIEGTVADAASGEGLADVEMEFQREGEPRGASERAFTDAAGRYRMEGLASGPYTVQPRRQRDYSGATPEAVTVAVRAGRKTGGVDFTLARGTSIRGRVLDANGGPAPGARVTFRGCERVYPVFSDRNGIYVVSEVRSGDSVTLFASTASLESGPVGPVAVPPSGIDGLDLVLAEDCSGAISGVLVSERGRPLSARISPLREGKRSPLTSGTRADTQGQFLLGGLAPGPYRLWATRGEDVGQEVFRLTLQPGQHVENLRLVYQLGDTVSIAGVVVDGDGRGIEATVDLSRLENYRRFEQARMQTAVDGTFEFADVADFAYTVTANAPGYEMASISDVPGNSTGLELVLQPRPRLRGRVLDERRDPIVKYDLAAESTSGIPMIHRVARTIFDPEGVFDLEVPSASYILTVGASGYATAQLRTGYIGTGRDNDAIEVVLRAAGRWRGRVVSRGGLPAGGATVFIGDTPLQPLRATDRIVAVADQDGTFELPAQDAGDSLLLSASHPDFGAGVVAAPGIEDGATADIVLYPTGRLSVSVTRDGQALPDVYVHLSRGREGMSARVDAEGACLFEDVPEGDVRIEVFDPELLESSTPETLTIRSGEETVATLAL